MLKWKCNGCGNRFIKEFDWDATDDIIGVCPECDSSDIERAGDGIY
jgi:ribosomal protein L37AE/L43A